MYVARARERHGRSDTTARKTLSGEGYVVPAVVVAAIHARSVHVASRIFVNTHVRAVCARARARSIFDRRE